MTAALFLVALVPPTSANHFPSQASCTLERDTAVLGGEVETRVLDIDKPSCHHPVACFDSDVGGCDFLITVTVTGAGVVDAYVDAFLPDMPLERCVSSPLSCTLETSYHVDHELHLNCGAWTTTVAADLTMTCTVQRVG